MRAGAADLARDTQTWLSELLNMPIATPQALLALRVPTSLGGLGFLHPQHEAALHYLQAMLPTVEELPICDEDENPLPRKMVECLEFLEHQAGKPLRPLIAHLAPHRMGQKLRAEFYEAQRLQMIDLCPWLQPPDLPTPQQLLSDGPLRYALQKHLGLPVYEGGQRCGYTPLTR